MLKAVAKTPEPFRIIATLLSRMDDEATFTATPEGLLFKIMGKGSVNFLQLLWSKDKFISYECAEEKKVGIRCNDFVNVFKRFDKKSPLEIGMKEGVMSLKCAEKKYDVFLVNPGTIRDGMPRLEFDTAVTIAAEVLREVIGDIKIMSEYLKIDIKGREVVFSSYRGVMTNVDNGEATIIKQVGDSKKDAWILLSSDYVSDFIDSVDHGELKLFIATNKAIKFEFEREDMGVLTYFLSGHNI